MDEKRSHLNKRRKKKRLFRLINQLNWFLSFETDKK